MSRASDRIFCRESLKIAIVVVAYWIISMSMVFINKYLLSSPDLKLNAPLFITWSQCVWTMALCWLASRLGQARPDLNFMDIPDITTDRTTALRVLPLSIIFASMITFNNLCLKHVTVAFYNIGRSLTTVFNVVFTYFILKETTSFKALFCCACIVGGFLLGVDQEGVSGSLSMVGVAFGVCASACVALNAIFTKRTLPIVDDNIWKLQYYNNLNTSLLFIPLMAFTGEFSVLAAFDKLFSLKFIFVTTVAGYCGFCIGFVTGLQVKVTSALTHNISGTAKACVQTVIAVIWFHDIKSFLWWISNFVVLGASAAYTQVRRNEMREKHEAAAKPMPSFPGVDGKDNGEDESPLISPSPTDEEEILASDDSGKSLA